MAEGIEPYFLIKGFIGSLPVSATWNGGYLMADTELLEVADILIRVGEQFHVDATRSIDAGLEDPLAAVLTVARSFDRITYANVTMPPGHELELGILDQQLAAKEQPKG